MTTHRAFLHPSLPYLTLPSLFSLFITLFLLSSSSSAFANMLLEPPQNKDSIINPFLNPPSPDRVYLPPKPRPLFDQWPGHRVTLGTASQAKSSSLCPFNPTPKHNPFPSHSMNWLHHGDWFHIQPQLIASFAGLERTWTLQGDSTSTYPLLEASLNGVPLSLHVSPLHPSSFQFTLNDNQVLDLLSGSSITLQFQPLCSPSPFVTSLILSPRLLIPSPLFDLSISSPLTRSTSQPPFTYQATLDHDPSYTLRDVFTDDDADISFHTHPNQLTIDISPEGLLLAADIQDDPLYFSFWDSQHIPVQREAFLLLEFEEALSDLSTPLH